MVFLFFSISIICVLSFCHFTRYQSSSPVAVVEQEKGKEGIMKISSSLVLAAAASSASAHTIFVSLNDGAVGDGVRVPSYDGVCPSLPLYLSFPFPFPSLSLPFPFPSAPHTKRQTKTQTEHMETNT
jgi:hypothetical protein